MRKKKARKIAKRKSEENEKSKDWRIRAVMILNPPEATNSKKMDFHAENVFSCANMPFPPEKCHFLQKKYSFLQKSAVS